MDIDVIKDMRLDHIWISKDTDHKILWTRVYRCDKEGTQSKKARSV